jgi:TIGR03009 family protein
LFDHLTRWEKKMADVKTLNATINRIDKDVVFNKVTELSGSAMYMKDGAGKTAQNLALLELSNKEQKTLAEKFICSGTYIYDFHPSTKEIRVIEIEKPRSGAVSDDNVLSFLLGMKAEEAMRRYQLKLNRVDQYYVYIDVAPRSAADRTEFKQAQIVLVKESGLPRRFWFKHPNDNETLWDIPNIGVNMKIDRRYFDAPRPPEGWKMVQVPRPKDGSPPPRAVRGGNP